MMELMGWKKSDWDFVGKRYIAFTVSGLLCALGLAAAAAIWIGKAPLGIDFAGGLSMNVTITQPVSLDAIRSSFAAKGIKDAQIQQLDALAGQHLLVRVREMGAEEDVKAILTGLAAGATLTVEGVSSVGPAVGSRLRVEATYAVFWAIILIMLYIWVRFQYRFGVAAALATFHDVLAVLGVMWLLQRDFTLLTVTALLTLAGYSLTDTVVVFDRIRENMRFMSRDPLPLVINKSINEILSRTALTSLTTMLPLVALLAYGSSVTHDFALALLLGVIVGTYSSWFVASTILVEWDAWRRRRAAEAAANRAAGR